MIRMNISISDELARDLGVMSEQSDTSKSDILRKAFTLFAFAREGKREGKKLALIDKDGRETEIIGL